MSRWNLFLDRVLELGPRLTKAELLLAIAIARSTLGWNNASEALGQNLLRSMSGLHGWGFGRARDGLIEKGLLRYTRPAPGRGQRGRYELLLGDASGARDDAVDSIESPVQERDFDSSESTAEERDIAAESTAQSTAQSTAPERGRIEERVEKNDDEGELDELLQGFADLAPKQLALFADAFRASPVGFRALVAQARQSARNPAAYLTARVQSGAHLSVYGPASPGAPESQLDKWLAGSGRRFDEDTASYVLGANFGLTGLDHEDAMRRWREHRAATDAVAADAAVGEQITSDLLDAVRARYPSRKAPSESGREPKPQGEECPSRASSIDCLTCREQYVAGSPGSTMLRCAACATKVAVA